MRSFLVALAFLTIVPVRFRTLPDAAAVARSRFWYPVVAETSDGRLNDMKGLHVKAEDAVRALESAHGGRIDEGNVGGGTGMVCHGFKGGTGTASRKLAAEEGGFTLGVLVQCNYGTRSQLRIAGIPVGREIVGYQPCAAHRIDPPLLASDGTPVPICDDPPLRQQAALEEAERGSIIVTIATNAPLTPDQLKRLVRRVSLGMGRMGSSHGNGSGDIFIAFSTANPGAVGSTGIHQLTMLPNDSLDPIFLATVQATEEAVINAMVAAETMKGINDHEVIALPHDRLREALKKYNRLAK